MRKWFYIFFLIPVFTACLESPEMTAGIVNEREKPTVATDSTVPFYQNGNLLFQGKIISEGKSEITEKGFYWSTVSVNPDSTDNTVGASDFINDVFTYEFSDAIGETIYYWRAYAKNALGDDYGEVVYSYRMPKDKPTVETISINPIISDGILLFQGNILDEGRREVTEKGFYWSTVSENLEQKDSIILSNTDVFSYELKNAKGEKMYYWQAFAKNAFGCDYGEIQSYQMPDVWVERDPLPVEGRGRGAVFMLSDRIYMTCGRKDADGLVFLKETWEYNITSHRWFQADSVSFPGDNRLDPVAFVIGDFAYVGTGLQTLAIVHKDFYRFSAESKTWTKIATPDDNFEERYGAIAFGIDGKGYVIGGLIDGGRIRTRNVWQYNPENDSWQQKNGFPIPINLGISIVGNNRVFAGFGETSDSYRKLWEYNIDKDEWDEFTTLPDETEINKIYSGVIVQNTIYVVDEKNIIWALDINDETKTWKKKADLPPVFRNERGEFLNQNMLTTDNSNRIYVGLEYSKHLYEYCPLWDN